MDTRAEWRKGLLLHGALPLSFLLIMLAGLVEQSRAFCQHSTISVEVNLVVLYVTARDSQGNFVSGLKQDDFRVFEDGYLQNVRLFQHEDAPVSAGLIVDNSTSMGRKRGDVTAAALAFVRSSNSRDQMFVVNFNERASLGLPPQEAFTADTVALERALNGVPAAGRTGLYDAIDLGLAHLTKATRDRKVLIVISDGGDNASRHSLSHVLIELEHADVPTYTIGLFDEFDADQNPGILKRIARVTGGQAVVLSNPSDVTLICERIAKEIRNQYTIAYVPSNQLLDNTYRKIRVTATRPHGGKVFVRTRGGYLAAPRGKDQPARELDR